MPGRAVILGAGPTGLVTAWKLLENGWSVELLEKLPLVGGLCRTWKKDGFLLDTGPHVYHTPEPELAALWEREFGDLLAKGEFWCKNVRGERFDEYWDYPLSWESIARYPRDLKERILSELGSRRPEDKARARNYTEYMEAEVGPTLRRLFFETYPRKLWGIPTDEMTPEWAPKRIEFRQKVTPFYHNQWNAAGKNGSGSWFGRLGERVAAAGGRIRLGAEVSGVRHDGRKLEAVLLAGGETVPLAPDDVVVSTLPLPVLAGFLGTPSALRFRGLCSVHVAYDRETVLPEGVHWLYYDSDRVRFHRVTEGKKISPGTAPPGRTVLTAEITYTPGDAVDAMDEGALLEETARGLEIARLAPRGAAKGLGLVKEPFVYPLQYAGFQEELARTRAAVSRFQQLYSTGAGGDFAYADAQIVFHKAFDLAELLCGRGAASVQVRRRTARTRLNPVVEVAGRRIGGGERAYLVAEAGLNHNGSPELARRLVDAAREAGCDAVKFQTFRPGGRISGKVKAVRYAETIVGTQETLAQMFDRLAMPFEAQRELFAYARGKGIEVFSTPFDAESADFLDSLGVSVFKIASMDLVNLPLIDRVARKGKPILLSTGMSTLGQIEEAVETVVQAGNPNLVLLHCNSTYPAPPEEMNLRAMKTLKDAFGVPVGLSDHTFGLLVSQTALALGVDAIERHFTLDRMMEGPDHILSSEPAEMAELVRLAERIPRILGDGVKRITPNEWDTINTQRKSLYAAATIEAGATIARDMVAVKGPGGGLLPRYLDVVVGRTARRRIEADHPITWEDI